MCYIDGRKNKYSVLRSYLEEEVAAPVQRAENKAVGSVTLTTLHPLSAKFDTGFVDNRRSLGRYSSVTEFSITM
jgi:hypothetical protein